MFSITASTKSFFPQNENPCLTILKSYLSVKQQYQVRICISKPKNLLIARNEIKSSYSSFFTHFCARLLTITAQQTFMKFSEPQRNFCSLITLFLFQRDWSFNGFQKVGMSVDFFLEEKDIQFKLLGFVRPKVVDSKHFHCSLLILHMTKKRTNLPKRDKKSKSIRNFFSFL